MTDADLMHCARRLADMDIKVKSVYGNHDGLEVSLVLEPSIGGLLPCDRLPRARDLEMLLTHAYAVRAAFQTAAASTRYLQNTLDGTTALLQKPFVGGQEALEKLVLGWFERHV